MHISLMLTEVLSKLNLSKSLDIFYTEQISQEPGHVMNICFPMCLDLVKCDFGLRFLDAFAN